MNRIPFDYDLIEKGYKPVYRSGKYPSEVKQFSTVKGGRNIISVQDDDLWCHFKNGLINDTGLDFRFDLFLEPPLVERITKVYSIAVGLHHYTVKETYAGDELISIELVK